MKLQTVRMFATCRECSQPVAVLRLFEPAVCNGCKATVSVSFGDLEELAPTDENHWESIGFGGSERGEVEQRDFVCAGCKQPLPEPTSEQLATGALTCSCKEVMRVRPLDESHALRTKTGVTHLLGEEAAPTPGEHAPAAVTVNIHCSNCGASLQTRGEKRAVSCSYCGTDSLIPDRMWAELHPAKVAPWIYLFRDPAAVAAITQAAAKKRKPKPLEIAVRLLGASTILGGMVWLFWSIVKAPKLVDAALITTGLGFVLVVASAMLGDDPKPTES